MRTTGGAGSIRRAGPWRRLWAQSARSLGVAGLLATSLVCAAAPVAAQGARPLDERAYRDALDQGRRGVPPGNEPFVMRLRVVRDAATLDAIEDAPFSFYIQTPYSLVSELAATRASDPGAARMLSRDEANAQLVSIEVTPGRIAATADAIFHVVLRRGEREIRPVTVRVVPQLMEDERGGEALLTTGSFSFPFHAFGPDAPLTIVLVGRRTSFEWTLSADELRALR